MQEAVASAVVEGFGCRPIAAMRLAPWPASVAHRHVFDHAPAQRADGLITHRGAPVLRWRLIDPLDSQDMTPGLSPAPAYLVTSSAPQAPRAARSCQAGSFVDRIADLSQTSRDVC